MKERTVPVHSCHFSGMGESSRSSAESSQRLRHCPCALRELLLQLRCSSCTALLVTVSTELKPMRPLGVAKCRLLLSQPCWDVRIQLWTCLAGDQWVARGLETGTELWDLENRWSLGWEEVGEEE